jgi:hypothetical protein
MTQFGPAFSRMPVEPSGSRRNHPNPVLAAGIKWFRRSIVCLAVCVVCLLNQHASAQSVAGPPNSILCNQTATFSADSADTKIISGASGKTIFVCGWNITNSASTGTIAITTGTTVTTACDTNTANITPTLSVTSSSPQVDHIDYAGVSAAVGANLCVTPSATTITGIIWYSQF